MGRSSLLLREFEHLPYNTWDLRKGFGGDNFPGGDGHVCRKKLSMQNYAKYKLRQRYKFRTTIVKKYPDFTTVDNFEYLLDILDKEFHKQMHTWLQKQR